MRPQRSLYSIEGVGDEMELFRHVSGVLDRLIVVGELVVDPLATIGDFDQAGPDFSFQRCVAGVRLVLTGFAFLLACFFAVLVLVSSRHFSSS